MLGLALDFSECDDRLPLALLPEVARRVGIPPEVAGPMLHCHNTLKRLKRVHVDGLAGATLPPMRGLPPACPAATRWLALVALCLERDANTLGAVLWNDVDDLVAVCRRPERLSAIDHGRPWCLASA